ncbi:GAP family protein [Streptomyces sp. TLI_171]|uniref:GAP family protein n=1 Tax=Streptomyces sp. TLI_171 TaxID=1938859 RepID=UPI000C18D707|nr:GAP family protein [Streptomyces sp. TLI_171]RKE05177.1 Sap-like sulfolipid-1-addressing protein [Streptomyces sp. TLI_171]
MGDAVGRMPASAVGSAISPLPLIAVLLMPAVGGRVNRTAFVLGRVVTLGVVTAAVALLGSGAGADDAGTPARWTCWLEFAPGPLILLMGARQWKDRPREGREHALPGRAAGLAALLSGASPKNLVVAVGGGASVASITASGGGKAVAGVLSVVVGSACVLLTLLVYVLDGERSAAVLGDRKTWVGGHDCAIMTVALAVLGGKYQGDAIGGLTS